MSRGEREWRVEDDALVTCGPTGRVRRYPWKDIVGVRLYCEPARARPWRYVFELQPRHEKRIEIDNAHFISAGQFEDRSEAYTPFVEAALRKVAAGNPKARALIGETPRRYFFLMLAVLLGFGVIAFALIAAPTPLDALPFALAAKLGIILLMLPVFWVWVLRKMPRGLPLDQLPPHVLPGPCAEAAAAPAEAAPSALP